MLSAWTLLPKRAVSELCATAGWPALEKPSSVSVPLSSPAVLSLGSRMEIVVNTVMVTGDLRVQKKRKTNLENQLTSLSKMAWLQSYLQLICLSRVNSLGSPWPN